MRVETPIESLDAAAYVIPTDVPAEGDGTLHWTKTPMVLVETTAAGQTGIGVTYGSGAAASVVTELLADQVVGQDAFDVGACWDAMVKAVRNAGRPGIAGTAISAADLALWDLKAKLHGLPLCRLLGTVERDVPVYGSGAFTTYDEDALHRQLTYWVHELGIPRVKMKVGESWGTRVDRDLARMRQAREIIGEGTELYIDANGAYSRKQAIRVAEEARDLRPQWYEEPVSSDDVEGLHQVRTNVLPDVTAGEYGYQLPYFETLCEQRAVDCLQVDIVRCGGISEWLRAAAVAASHSLEVSGHTSPHMHAHAAAVTTNLRHTEWFHTHVRIEEMLFDGTLDPSGGVIRPGASGAPGHGLEFKRRDAEPYRTK